MPEITFRQGKNEPHGRAFFDDLLILDTADSYRVLAARGVRITRGKPLTEIYRLSIPSKRLMKKPFLPTDAYRVVACGSGASLLLFPQLLPAAGLLVAVRIPLPPVRLAESISLMQETELLSPFSSRRDRLRTTVPAKLEELFYYINRIFFSEEQVSLYTLLQLVANFTGCRLGTASSVPMLPLNFSDIEWKRLTAFLLCAFLTIRRRTGTMAAMGCDSDSRQDIPPSEKAVSVLLRLQQDSLCRFPWTAAAPDAPEVSGETTADEKECPVIAMQENDAGEPTAPDTEFSEELQPLPSKASEQKPSGTDSAVREPIEEEPIEKEPPEDIRYFADHPAFRSYSVTEAPDGALVFDMTLKPDPRLSSDVAVVPERLHLYLLLEPEDPLLDPKNITLF